MPEGGSGRLIALVAAGALLTYGRPSVYSDTWTALHEGESESASAWWARCHAVANATVAAQLVGYAVAGRTVGSRWSVPAQFAAVRLVSAKGLPGRWPYNTFLEPLVLLSCAGDVMSNEERDALARFVVFLTYSQAGLSKLVHGSKVWLRDGDAVSRILDRYGASRSVRRRGRPARLERGLSRIVPVLELMALPSALLAGGRLRRVLVCGSITFHAMIWRELRISFWELGAVLVILGAAPQSPSSDGHVLRQLITAGETHGVR